MLCQKNCDNIDIVIVTLAWIFGRFHCIDYKSVDFKEILKYQVMLKASWTWMGRPLPQKMWTMIVIQAIVQLQSIIQVVGGLRIASTMLSIQMVLTMVLRKRGIQNQ